MQAAVSDGKRWDLGWVQQGTAEGPGFPLETDTPGSPQDRLDDSLCYVWRWGQVRDERN